MNTSPGATSGNAFTTARTASGGPDECLLTAHLCHPAPGANDNASGVAGALAVAGVLARRPLRRRLPGSPPGCGATGSAPACPATGNPVW